MFKICDVGNVENDLLIIFDVFGNGWLLLRKYLNGCGFLFG